MSVRFAGVTKSFGSQTVLRDLSFESKKGEILFILGKSGTGKSVTLKHLVGLLKPDRGRVYVEDVDITDLSEVDLAPVRRVCGMVFQHPALLDSLSVRENVAFGLKNSDAEVDETDVQLEQIIQSKLALVHLGTEVLDRFPPEISYGMQKRVSLARTLAPGPRILLFDEPTTGLDPITTNAIMDLIKDLSKRLAVTSLVVSHDMASALRVADRILVIDQGQVVELGTPAHIEASQSPLIQDFLQETLELRGRR